MTDLSPMNQMNGTRDRWHYGLGVLVLAALLAGCGKDESTLRDDVSKPKTVELSESSSAGQDPESSEAGLKPEPLNRLMPKFDIVAAESGFDFQRYDDMHGQRRIIETNGGGVGLLDIDGDHRLDIFMTNGCRLPLSLNDHSTPSVLFRNLGHWQFERCSDNAFLQQFGYAHGCSVGDLDSDGFDDLYVTAFGPNSLWRNNGDGTFSDATIESGTSVPVWSSSAAFADLNLDGHLDLYVVNYLDESDETPRLCPNPASPTGYEGCSPAIFDGVDDVLFLSDGTGRMVDVSANCGLAGLRGKGLGVVITDLDDDLVPEVYVANDGEANFLFKSNVVNATSKDAESALLRSLSRASPAEDFHLTNLALASATALNESGFAQASMGIAAGDYDGNGTTDLFLTHFYGDTNTLYENSGQLVFRDATRSSRLGPLSRQTLGFGTVFLDADQDGWLDLFIANGHVDDRTWMPQPQPYHMPPQLMVNRLDGTFQEASAWAGNYFNQPRIGRGVAAGDLDSDGRTDLVVSHQLAPSVVLRNVTASHARTVRVRLIGTVSNRSAIGAAVEFSAGGLVQRRTISAGGSFQSASSRECLAAFPEDSDISIQVIWPGGRRQSIDQESGLEMPAAEGD